MITAALSGSRLTVHLLSGMWMTFVNFIWISSICGGTARHARRGEQTAFPHIYANFMPKLQHLQQKRRDELYNELLGRPSADGKQIVMPAVLPRKSKRIVC